MQEPIELTYQISRQECVTAAMSRRWSGARMWLFFLCDMLLLAWGVISIVESGDSVPLFFFIVLAGIHVFSVVYTRWRARWLFARTPGIMFPLTVCVYADRVTVDSAAGQSEIHRLWRVAEDSKFVFGYISAATYVLIPKRVFSSQEQMEEVRGVLQRLANVG
ncbi:MAG: YcxB family protein [Candidatus Hydrogenedentales bacterium]